MERLLDKPETAARLNIELTHLDYLVQKRRIPFVRVGRLTRFKPSDLEQWLEENRTDVGGSD